VLIRCAIRSDVVVDPVDVDPDPVPTVTGVLTSLCGPSWGWPAAATRARRALAPAPGSSS